MIQIQIPADWPHPHIPTWEYDEDGDIEVSNFICGVCLYHGSQCKCIDHKWVHFVRPYFKCDQLTSWHSICKGFAPHPGLYPAGCLEWDALGGFDEWYRIWRKQWHYNRAQPWGKVGLIRANMTLDEEHDVAKNREFSDDVYYVSYTDFLNCNIMNEDGIHCIDYSHIEIARNTPIGYKWVHEGPGIWVPWDNNKYITA